MKNKKKETSSCSGREGWGWLQLPCRTESPWHCCLACPAEATSTWCPSRWAPPAGCRRPHPTWPGGPPGKGQNMSNKKGQYNGLLEHLVYFCHVYYHVYYHITLSCILSYVFQMCHECFYTISHKVMCFSLCFLCCLFNEGTCWLEP